MAYIVQMFPDNRIRELRKKAGLSQGELGELVGLHQTQIGNLENGSRNLTFEWARRIAAALGVNMVDILGEEDNPYRLSAEEKALIGRYRNAADSQREIIERVAAPLHELRASDEDKQQSAA